MALDAELRLYSADDLATELMERGLDMTEQEVLAWLREHGYLISLHGPRYNAPSQLCLEYGLMHERQLTTACGRGRLFVEHSPLLTHPGREFIMPRLIRYATTRQQNKP